jgi:hypothetical protein
MIDNNQKKFLFIGIFILFIFLLLFPVSQGDVSTDGKKEAFWVPAIGLGGITWFNALALSAVGIGTLIGSWAIVGVGGFLLISGMGNLTGFAGSPTTTGIPTILIWVLGAIMVMMLFKSLKR